MKNWIEFSDSECLLVLSGLELGRITCLPTCFKIPMSSAVYITGIRGYVTQLRKENTAMECAIGKSNCNCDSNDQVWREDSGLLTNKTHLPVSQLRFGDTGGSKEEGYHTLGN